MIEVGAGSRGERKTSGVVIRNEAGMSQKERERGRSREG